MKKYMKRYLLPIFPLLLLFLMLMYDREDASKEVTVIAASDSLIALEEMNIAIDDLIRMNRWGRNPFLPYYHCMAESKNDALSSAKMFEPVLENIFWAKNKRHARINNQHIEQGNHFLGMRVDYIGKNIVVLTKEQTLCMILKNADK